MGRNWDGVVVVCAGTRWDGMPSSEHHIAGRLSEWAPVMYVDPPTSIATAYRYAGFERTTTLRIVSPRLVRLTPVVLPGMRRAGMVAITETLVRRRIRSAL